MRVIHNNEKKTQKMRDELVFPQNLLTNNKIEKE